MKILQICDRAHDFAKAINLFDEAARGLTNAGHQVTYCTLIDTRQDGVAAPAGYDVYTFGMKKNKVRASNVVLLFKLWRYIRSNRFDIVITHRFKPWLLLALISPLLPGCRFISFFRAFKQFDRKRRQWLAKLYLNGRWRIGAVSEAVRADLITHGIAAPLTVVIHNAIDIEHIRAGQLERAAARKALGIPDGATTIGTLGRAHPVKGQKYLIDAFVPIAAKLPDAHLIIIGGGELENALRQQAERAELSTRIQVTGALYDAYRYLQALDLFVLPSQSEGFGIAIVEAMASALPVIGSRVGGIPEAMGPHGILVERASVRQLTEAIERVLAYSATQREEYIAQLQQHLRDKFSIEHYHFRYCELVAELAGSARA